MSSRASSRSEGELSITSDSDPKATKSLPSRNGTHVDRHTRPTYSHSSTPRSPHRRSNRSRSRSPYRAPRGEKRRREDDHPRDRPRHDSRRFNVRYEDDNERGIHRRSYLRYENDDRREREPSRSRNGTDSETTSNKIPHKEPKPAEHPKKPEEEAVEAPLPILDEAALIEKRRKRREAIKNKYRSPAPTSPQTPLETSMPQSPANLSFARDEDLANNNVDSPADQGDDEPSAADYDPTVDMQEERARHDKRMFKEDEASTEAADQKVAEQSIAREASPKNPNPAAAFDMFADDEDDDMFSEAPSKYSQQALPEKKTATALDVNMMDNWDDPEGYYNTILGELIENRYHVTQNLGRGMFSSVVRATDTTTNELVAIKIVRNNDSMRKAGIKEIDILNDIAANDPEDKKHVIRLHRFFDHKGHLCMVFENLSLNLREVLKKFGRDVGINLKAIRAYAQQLFLGLSLLRKCQYLHADLKPDNILVNEGRNVLKICDLGSASPVTENVTAPYLVSRFYRAPEIILGLPYDAGIDMWSVGCTLFELYTGKILFTGRNNNGMLRSIMECRGKFPHKLLRKGALTYQYFDDLLNFQAIDEDRVTGRMTTKMIDIKSKPVRDLRMRLLPKGKRLDDVEKKEVELFLDLLEKCLDLRPEKRITPVEALRHPFILRAK